MDTHFLVDALLIFGLLFGDVYRMQDFAFVKFRVCSSADVYPTGTVSLVVRYTPRVLDEMEARFDKQRARRRQTP